MESEVLEVMQHMAKNVVKVNDNRTKFIVSAPVPSPDPGKALDSGLAVCARVVLASMAVIAESLSNGMYSLVHLDYLRSVCGQPARGFPHLHQHLA